MGPSSNQQQPPRKSWHSSPSTPPNIKVQGANHPISSHPNVSTKLDATSSEWQRFNCSRKGLEEVVAPWSLWPPNHPGAHVLSVVLCSLFFVAVVVVVVAAGPNHQKYAEYGTVPQDWSHVVSTLRSNPSKHADMLYAKPISTDSNLIVQQQFDSTCKAYTNILYYFSGFHIIDI